MQHGCTQRCARLSPRPLVHNSLRSLFSPFNFLYRLRRLQPDIKIRTKRIPKSRREMKVASVLNLISIAFPTSSVPKEKKAQRNLTRYNLADCSYARATNKMLSAPIVLLYGLHTRAGALNLDAIRSLIKTCAKMTINFIKAPTRASACLYRCSSLSGLLLFSRISNQRKNESAEKNH